MEFHAFVHIFLCGSLILWVSANSTTSITEAPISENSAKNANESTTKIHPTEPEKIDEFHDYIPKILYDWKEVEKAYNAKDIKFLRYLCIKVHELAGWGRVNVINNFIMDQAVIVYQNPTYFPTDTKFLQYVIEPPQTFERDEMMDHFYITEGLKEDCIFYLKPIDKYKLNSFNLGHHVCGVHRALKGLNATSESPCPAVAEG